MRDVCVLDDGARIPSASLVLIFLDYCPALYQEILGSLVPFSSAETGHESISTSLLGGILLESVLTSDEI